MIMKNTVLYCLGALMAATLGSCTLHQEPDGIGEDPTEVLLNVDFNINMDLPQRDVTVAASRAAAGYSHRFVIEAVGNDLRVHDRRIVCVPADEAEDVLMLPINMRLHARDYQILVWSDYVNISDADTVTFYNAQSLTPVMPMNSFRANTEYKDAFSACAPLDLRPFVNEWQAKVNLDVELSRPVGRYELITTDVAAFQHKLAEGIVNGSSFSARIRYAGYIATGYNVAEQMPKNMLSFLGYTTSLGKLITTADNEYAIGFDFVICPEAGEEIPVQLEILNEKSEVVSNTAVNIPLKAGYNTTVKGCFLTATTDGGVNIDPGFNGSVDIDLGQL